MSRTGEGESRCGLLLAEALNGFFEWLRVKDRALATYSHHHLLEVSLAPLSSCLVAARRGWRFMEIMNGDHRQSKTGIPEPQTMKGSLIGSKPWAVHLGAQLLTPSGRPPLQPSALAQG